MVCQIRLLFPVQPPPRKVVDSVSCKVAISIDDCTPVLCGAQHQPVVTGSVVLSCAHGHLCILSQRCLPIIGAGVTLFEEEAVIPKSNTGPHPRC